MKYLFFLGTIILSSVIGCKKKVVLDYEFESNRLLTQASIDVSKGVEVYLTKTFSPTETINLDTMIVDDAIITLFMDNDSIGQVEYSSEAMRYYYTNLENIHVGSQYSLKINSPNYPILFSDAVVLIEDPDVELVSIIRTNAADTASRLRETEITLSLLDNFDENNMYLIDWSVGSNAGYSELQIQLKDGSILNCPVTINPYFLDNCFNGQSNIPIVIYASYRDSMIISVDDLTGEILRVATDTTRLNFRSVDEVGQQYLRSQSFSIFEGETNVPPITFSNMSNGIGVFYSVGHKSYTLPSP